MKEDTKIKPMTLEDWNKFNSLHSFENEISESSFRGRVEKGGFFGLFIGDFLIGHLNLNPYGDDECHFQSIFIDPEYRGRGLSHLFMKKTFEWFKENRVKKAHLYTMVTNKIAQNLYKKYGFRIHCRAYEFIVPFSRIDPKNEYTSREIGEDEIDQTGDLFERLPVGEIRRWLNSDNRIVLIQKDTENKIVGATIFTTWYPGCRPFEILNIQSFDDFILGIKPYSLPELDFVRIVVIGNDELATLCKIRGYEMVHEMFFLTWKVP